MHIEFSEKSMGKNWIYLSVHKWEEGRSIVHSVHTQVARSLAGHTSCYIDR